MPRIYTSQSNPLDFCQKHFPKTESAARDKYGNLGDGLIAGTDNRGNCFGYDVEHPSYDDDYSRCHVLTCRKLLTGKDDYFIIV